ncbi:MAG: RlmE family RNA methyltransferase [Bacteriovoracaceae bacterium]|nr:RlmE family RNA methyltransferase [Bacteriovoracaceae bacterium]
MTFKVKDHYFKKAKKENFLARSIYKLEEIDKKHKIFNKEDKVLDLGYHPGSWTQYVSGVVGENGIVVGADIKPVNKKLLGPKNIFLHEKDVFDISGPEDLDCSELFDVVISDMAPNTTGVKSVDQDRSLALIEKIIEILPATLKPNGHLIFKIFDSNDAQNFIRTLNQYFEKVSKLKPKSTRSVSKEFFVIGMKYKA